MHKLFATLTIVFACIASAAPARADTTAKPAISDLAFLIGTWSTGFGAVAETDETSRGSSSITSEVGGNALLRRDHVELFGKGGKSTGAFDIIMLIYPEAGTIRADYSDGTHVIHYTSAAVEPGHSVAFSTAVTPGAVAYRLTYTLATPTSLGVRFEISPTGDGTFSPIATGSLTKG